MQRTLLDAEQRGARGVFLTGIEALAAAPCPAHREFHRGGDFVARTVGTGAFVEGHDDVRAEQALDFHAALGGEHVLAAIEVAAEFDALLGQLAQLAEAHHLIAAGIGQDRAVPVHEPVKTAKPRDAFGAGAQHKVIGVAEDYVRAGCTHSLRLHRLDRGGGANRHEGRRADLAALHRDDAGARLAGGGVEGEGKSGGSHRACALASLRGAVTPRRGQAKRGRGTCLVSPAPSYLRPKAAA